MNPGNLFLGLSFEDPRPIPQDQDVRFPQEDPWNEESLQSAPFDCLLALLRKKCTMGVACPFAHCKEELNAPPDLSKTKLCVPWHHGIIGAMGQS